MRARAIDRVLDLIIFDYCDPILIDAIVGFGDAVKKNPSLTLVSKKHSIFSVIKLYLDDPFDRFFTKYGLEINNKFYLPSNIKYPVYLTPKQWAEYNALSKYNQIRYSLHVWEERITDLIGFHRDETGHCDAGLNSYKALIYMLPSLCPHGKESILKGKAEPSEVKLTDLHLKSGPKHCLLCWRELPDLALHNNEVSYNELKRVKSNYCDYHDRENEDKNGWNNYISGRKYAASFDYELGNITRPNRSKFLLPPKWFFAEAVKLGFAMGTIERRKLIYYLVRSGLDNERNKAIYKLREKGLSVTEITKKVKNKKGNTVTKQYVSKCLKTIDKKIDDVIHSPTLESDENYSERLEPYTLTSTRNGQKYTTLRAVYNKQ